MTAQQAYILQMVKMCEFLTSVILICPNFRTQRLPHGLLVPWSRYLPLDMILCPLHILKPYNSVK